MKKRYYFIIAVASYFALLIATIPARPVIELLNNSAGVNIQGINGTIWNGSAYAVTINNNIQLKKSAWSFNLWKLFIGRIAIDINTNFLDNDINTEIGSTFTGRVFINKLAANIPAEELTRLANIPLAQLSGMIALNIDNAQWKQGEAPLANGTITWNNAAVTVADTASLGNVSVILSESDQQILNAEIKNQGGDIKISGSAQLKSETDYDLNAVLTPTATANNNIKQSLGFIAQQQPNGEFHLKKSGTLKQIM